MRRVFLWAALACLAAACGDDSHVPADVGMGLDAPTRDANMGVDTSAVGDSGPSAVVDRTRRISSVTPAEVGGECQRFLEGFGGPGAEFDCGSGIEITNQTLAECTTTFADVTCENTLAEMDACVAAIAGDPCQIFANEDTCGFVGLCARSE